MSSGSGSRRCFRARPPTPGPTADNRRFLDAVLYIARTGVAWRDLPPLLGHWNSVWRRFRRFGQRGTWRRVFEALQEPDLEWLMLDSTVVRAHRHAAGAPKKVATGPSAAAAAGSRPRFTSPPTPSATPSGCC